MTSLNGLPPLPKSLSGLMNFSSAQWKEMERIHAMRTMIQQDLGYQRPRTEFTSTSHNNGNLESSAACVPASRSIGGSLTLPHRLNRTSRLDAQLALLRKEMVGLRQLDMSLLCQLWSLNESIHDYKKMVGDKIAESQSFTSSPGWEPDANDSSSDEEYNPNLRLKKHSITHNKQTTDNHLKFNLQSVPRRYKYHQRRISSSSSSSSIDFGDV